MIHEDNISNKLIVLFVLENMEFPIKEESLLDICSEENEWIPYFFCTQVITELIKGGFILKIDAESNPMLTLSEDGHHCLSHFTDDIPKSVRDAIKEYCRVSRLKYKKKQEFFCDYKKNADGTYTVEMKIFEVVKPIFQLKLVVSYQQALSIYNSWNNKAIDAYKLVYDLLLDT